MLVALTSTRTLRRDASLWEKVHSELETPLKHPAQASGECWKEGSQKCGRGWLQRIVFQKVLARTVMGESQRPSNRNRKRQGVQLSSNHSCGTNAKGRGRQRAVRRMSLFSLCMLLFSVSALFCLQWKSTHIFSGLTASMVSTTTTTTTKNLKKRPERTDSSPRGGSTQAHRDGLEN